MQIVKDGKEKQKRYASEYSQFKKALTYQFYLEAVSIGYAIVEDRLVSFLHYAGIVSMYKELKINKPVYPYMRRLLLKDDEYSIKIKDINVKLDIIKKLINMSEKEAIDIDSSVEKFIQSGKPKNHIAKPGYMKSLYDQLEGINRQKAIDVLGEIDSWRDDRNHLIHALLNKNVSSSTITKKKCAEDCYDITRKIDDCLSKAFKKNNNIRQKYRIQ